MKNSLLLLSFLLLLTACIGPAKNPTADAEPSAKTAVTVSSATESTQVLVPNSPLRRDVDVDALNHSPDLFSRMRQQFRLSYKKDAAFQRELAFYRKQQGFLAQALQRAEPYLYQIVQKLEARNMPVELALLPIVESGFNPNAVGVGGPTGLWQLMPQTGRRFGLPIKADYDGRRDILRSTDALLDYLTAMNQQMNQDWILTVAGYNSGENRILQALERQQKRGLATDFWSLGIPQRYTGTVPKWLAVVELFKEPERYQLQLPTVANAAKTEMIAFSGRYALTDLAKASGLSLPEFKRLNPGFRHNVSSPFATHLLLPISATPNFHAHLAQLQQAPAQTLALAEPEADVKVYRVQAGDTLGSIAKRHQISVSALKNSNQLRTDHLKIGQRLRLPVAAGSKPVSAYIVKKGDSIDKIARKLKIKPATLLEFNHLSATSVLKVGQTLKLPPTSN